MEKTIITMSSITYAMKAMEYLNSMGYRCDVERTRKNIGSGCGYSIIIRVHPDLVTPLLDRAGIPYKGIYRL
ncbi:MAG: DUF3343 domain-containing protein [Ruminococcus sp.]|uniref:DUF3343 domain-containing protein n=1 Tax=Ruminococcus sp. TaxID=41978 RepID=UPI0025E83E2D|nr:DUF3343 domain-containing protein [Ruminococcus sp.]MBQ9542901.1 DUF3343 domain-containing protein [Ruminococcus sp.]MBR0528334.1 DUF3343 domain-containing protein [Ruminococcus sp.]